MNRRIGTLGFILPLLLLLALAMLWPSGDALAQGRIVPGQQAPLDAMHGNAPGQRKPARVRVLASDKAGTARARIQVVRQNAPGKDAPLEPAAGVEVSLQWRADNAERLALSYQAKTGGDGIADFGTIDVLKDQRRFELRAVVQQGGVPHISPRLVPQNGQVSGQLEMLYVTGEPDAVVGGALVTILGIPGSMNRHPASYGYIQVQQMVELTTGDWAIYDTQNAMRAADARGVKFEVPLKAGSVQAQVVGGGVGKTEVADSTVYYAGTIYPASEDYPSVRLMVSYFLKADGDELEFEQPMSLPFADVRLTFLRETDLPNHPVIDVEFDAPQFTEFSDEATEGVMKGRRVIVARGLSLAAGDTLAFSVQGLPYPDDRIPFYLGLLAFVIVIGGAFLAVRERRRKVERNARLARGDAEAVAEIEEQIEALYAGLSELEQDLDDAEISEADYAMEHARLRTRLAMLLQRRDEVHRRRAAADARPGGRVRRRHRRGR